MLKKAPRPAASKFVSRVSRAREAIDNANNFYTNAEVTTLNGHEGAADPNVFASPMHALA